MASDQLGILTYTSTTVVSYSNTHFYEKDFYLYSMVYKQFVRITSIRFEIERVLVSSHVFKCIVYVGFLQMGQTFCSSIHRARHFL